MDVVYALRDEVQELKQVNVWAASRCWDVNVSWHKEV